MSRMKKPRANQLSAITITNPGVGYLTPPDIKPGGVIKPPSDPETVAGPLFKPIPRWGTAASLYDYHSPLFSALLEMFEGIRVSFRGYKACHNCWHRGRVGPFAACYHPKGVVECRPDVAWPGYQDARFFLQRPSFWFRLRHRDWRKMRFAAMKLAPVEQEAGDSGVQKAASVAAQFGAITRRAFMPSQKVQLYKSNPGFSQLISPPPPPPAAPVGLGGTSPVPPLSRKP